MSNRSKRPTQKTIAEKAGISIGTVSRALLNDPLIAAKTRDLVRRTATEVGYTPDRAAQQLRTGRTNVINLILPPHEEILGFGTSIVRGITSVLSETPYSLVVMPDLGPDQSYALIQRVVREGVADGILFSKTEPEDQRIRFLLEADFPFVCHGRSELATPHPYVDFDNFEFARTAVFRLISDGVTRLAILLPSRQFTFSNHILHGFMSAVRETGIAYEFIESTTLDSHPEKIELAIRQRYMRPDPPDGLILPGEVSGLAALAAIQDLGFEPGKDIHLLVKQTAGIFGFVRPRVSSLYEDLVEAGENLAGLLMRRIEGESAKNLQFLQPVKESPER